MPLLMEKGRRLWWTDNHRFVWCRSAANVAPTEEIIMIATETASAKLLVWRSSLLLGALILFYSDFTGAQRFSQERGIKTVVSAVVTYIALVASAAILWF